VGGVTAIAIGVYIAFQVSPWPAVMLIRRSFDQEAARASQALEKHVPAGVRARLHERYDPADGDAHLDVFHPEGLEASQALTTIVWVHGGGWVSGTKGQVANYAKILASRGHTVVGVDYSVAPDKTYPTPVRQVNAALAFLQTNAATLHVDPSRFVLAGDSGGAHIAAQLANVIGVPSYAAALGIVPAIRRPQLRGVILYCGAYDTKRINLDGPFGGFLKTVLWSYSGGRDFMIQPTFATASVIDYVTSEFPPLFISAGNGDPLLGQSRAFARVVGGLGVPVDSLFFPHDHVPALPHEFQFDLDTGAGRTALERSIRFLRVHGETNAEATRSSRPTS
jgi:acetyl esterase/lipase